MRVKQHGDETYRENHNETHAEPNPKRFTAVAGNQATRYSLQKVKEYHENDDPSFFVHNALF